MVKNKAVRILAVLSTIFCAMFAICIFAFIAFSSDLIGLYINDAAVTEVKIVPAGYVIKLICAAALIALNARLLLGKGVKSNLYGSCAAAAFMMIGSTAAKASYTAVYKSVEEVLAFAAMNNLSDWVQPFLLTGVVMSVAACALDTHIQSGRKRSMTVVKAGLGITAAYAVIFLLIIVTQKSYTGADIFIFPLGSMAEFVMALCMIISSVLMLNGSEPALPITVSVGSFITCGFAETPLNFAYTYFLTRFLGAEEIAAMGTVAGYAGLAAYLLFAGTAVTVACALTGLYDKSSGR